VPVIINLSSSGVVSYFYDTRRRVSIHRIEHIVKRSIDYTLLPIDNPLSRFWLLVFRPVTTKWYFPHKWVNRVLYSSDIHARSNWQI